MTFSTSCVLLGRWGSRDFLRGRSKKGGAVHTRHTHGSQGRYKRLSTQYGLRDGRRHATNHTQGGLGIKLGGGLFGARIPRQHKLSTMTPEEYALEIHGHPNITNPYRELMHEHPKLREVMENASIALQLVVLMPRVSRTFGAASASNSNTTNNDNGNTNSDANSRLTVVPPRWEDVEGTLAPFLKAVGSSVDLRDVILTTLDASVHVQDAQDMHAKVSMLYDEHKKGKLLRPDMVDDSSSSSRKNTKNNTKKKGLTKSMSFMGDAMRSVPGALQRPSTGGGYTSAALALALSMPSTPDDVTATRNSTRAAAAAAAASSGGVADVLRQLHGKSPNALCVCLRSAASAEHQPPVMTRETHRQPLLKADVQLDEEEGVWAHPRCAVEDLLRWHYSNRDPRAHSGDALPHRGRQLPVILLVDASKTPTSRFKTAPAQSLLSKECSKDLDKMGFKALDRAATLHDVAAALQRWSVTASWDLMMQRDAVVEAAAQQQQQQQQSVQTPCAC